MKTVNDVMTRDVVWVSPSAKLKQAVILLRGYSIGALPVVYEDSVVGVITSQNILGQPLDLPIMEVMDKEIHTISPDTTVQDAAELMAAKDASHLLVVDDGGLVGIVSHSDIIREIGKYTDPLTGLPGSDRFREWIRTELMKGHETTIIYFDMDLFWLFNKKHGHAVGDQVLLAAANELKKHINADTDVLCRIGGDEFGIATLRPIKESMQLAEKLAENIRNIKLDNVTESIAVTYGIAGGRRTKEREETHFDATVDGLLNLASKDCTARKPHKVGESRGAETTVEKSEPKEQEQVSIERAPRLEIESIGISTSGMETTVSVSLKFGETSVTHEASGYAVGRNVLRLVAEAAAGALGKHLEPGHGVVVDDVATISISPEQQAVTAWILYVTPASSSEHIGSAIIRRGEPYRAAAAAVLNAVNRIITPKSKKNISEGSEEPTSEH